MIRSTKRTQGGAGYGAQLVMIVFVFLQKTLSGPGKDGAGWVTLKFEL